MEVPGAHVMVIAEQDLEAGEEILIDYLPPVAVLREWREAEMTGERGNSVAPVSDEEAEAVAQLEREERERELVSQYGIPREDSKTSSRESFH